MELRSNPPGAHDSFLEDKILEVTIDVQLKDYLRNLNRIMESETS